MGIKNKIVIIIFLFLTLPICFAQSTTVSATLVDTSATTWADAKISITFVQTPNTQGPFIWTGGTYNPGPINIVADSSGHFSHSLPSNNFISPANSTWQFQISPNASSQAVTLNIPVTGSTMDISGLFTAATTPLAIQTLSIPRAYNVGEVVVPPNVGQLFYDTIAKTYKYWDGSTWQSLATSAPGGCTSDCVITDPTTTQSITQPVNTNFAVNTSGSGALRATQTFSNLFSGNSLNTSVIPAIITTATSTSGSNVFVVTSATGIAIGMSPVASFIPTFCNLQIGAFTVPIVTNVSGTNITMSCNANSTVGSPTTITFGFNRLNSTASVNANTVATNWLLIGGAAKGNSECCGYSDPSQMNAQIRGFGNSPGLLVSAYSSDMTSGSGTRPLTGVVTMDTYNGSATNKNSWVGYFESHLNPGTTDQSEHIQFEHSVNNMWNAPSQDEDPYTVDIINGTINERLDCGTGQTFGSGSAPHICSTALDILNNGAQYRQGIVIGLNALDTSSSRIAPVMAMPPSTGFNWYVSPGNHPTYVYGDSSGNLQLMTNGGNVVQTSSHDINEVATNSLNVTTVNSINFNATGSGGFNITTPIGIVTNKVGNGTGLFMVRTTSVCAPANTAFAACTQAIAFPITEPDANYSPACSIDANNAFVGSIGTRTTTGFNVTIYATGIASPVIASLSCLVMHN